MTILLATHDPSIAARADRLLRKRDGALIDDLDLTSTDTTGLHEVAEAARNKPTPPTEKTHKPGTTTPAPARSRRCTAAVTRPGSQ